MADTDAIIASAQATLERKNTARDRVLVESRTIVRHAATAIRALHRGDGAEAGRQLLAAAELVQAARELLREYPDLYWAGYVQDGQKEFAEARLVAAMVRGDELPDHQELGVEIAPYLNGLAEAASEMRRYVLDIIRHGDPERMRDAERVLVLMDDIYAALITVDFPDAITGGLRRTTDSLRAVLERSRSDLTLSMRQYQLERALGKASEVS